MKSRNKWKRFLMDDRGTLILQYPGDARVGNVFYSRQILEYYGADVFFPSFMQWQALCLLANKKYPCRTGLLYLYTEYTFFPVYNFSCISSIQLRCS